MCLKALFVLNRKQEKNQQDQTAVASQRWRFGLATFEPLWWFIGTLRYDPAAARGTTMLQLAASFELAQSCASSRARC